MLETQKPAIIGVTSFSYSYTYLIEAIESIRIHTNTPIVVGGRMSPRLARKYWRAVVLEFAVRGGRKRLRICAGHWLQGGGRLGISLDCCGEGTGKSLRTRMAAYPRRGLASDQPSMRSALKGMSATSIRAFR